MRQSVALVLGGRNYEMEFISMPHLRRVRFILDPEPPHDCTLAQLQWGGSESYLDLAGTSAQQFCIQWNKWVEEA